MEKSVFKSKGIWGAVISALSFIVMGIAGHKDPSTLATATGGFLSAIYAAYGRYTAKHKLVLREKKIKE